ncbi:NPCBM/NEW2 domain-containing protein [candidate division KSB1 bacterium]|nr:NPCBM/NEW2 domain-containing protein [candidate division KSB1 bacterium]
MPRKLFIIMISLLVSTHCAKESKTENAPANLAFLQWAPTPPMGWNSWDCYGPTVTEKEVKANADYMAEHLKEFGWQYIVVDIRWYVDNTKTHGYNQTNPVYNMDEYGRFTPSPVRFPSAADGNGFKPLADYVHSKGLKFGIHVMRGIPREAVRNNTPILGSTATATDIYSEEQLCRWLSDMYTIVAGRPGAQEYYNSIFNLYASWGVDFVKIDDLSIPYHRAEIEMIRQAIDQTGRPMVLSTSPGETPIENAEHIKTHANMWRIIGDFWDNWPQLKNEFEVCNRWAPHIGDGHFPDADMLPLGRIGIRAERGNDRMSGFTRDEQYTLMTLFAICRSPLMFGGDLPSNDEFTLSLLTNKEVLAVNQKSSNNRQLFRKDDLIAWTADDPQTGDVYLALFNTQEQKQIEGQKAAWTSRLVSAKDAVHSVDVAVDISGARKLYLVVADGGDGNAWDHADWIAPKLVGQDGELSLTELQWRSATSGWNAAAINKSVSGQELIVDDITRPIGIGTHSISVIEFDVPAGYERFLATAGLDKACIESGDGATVKFMVFTQDPAGPEPPDSAQIAVQFDQLGLAATVSIRDLWAGKDVGIFANEFAPVIAKHGAGLYRLSAGE